MNEIGLSDFFDLTPDLVWIAGKDGFLKKVNHAVIEKLGYTEEELYASPITTFIYPGDVEMTVLNRAKLHKGEVLHNFCNRYVSKTGNIIWLEWTSVYIADKETVLAIAKDITARKKIEKEVEEQYNKFKGLTTHFKSHIEKDRKYFAYELHEEVAQLAAAVKLDISWVVANVPGLPASSKSRIENAELLSELLIKKIQRIAFSISPNMLGLFGLNDTLKWLINEFTILNGIHCSFETEYDEGSLTKEMKIDFFRICQEALTNITDHAEASNVKISIEDVGNKIQLSIIDNGKGFDIDQKKQTSGFSNMHGRAASINGSLIIQSEPGKGTTVCLVIEKPLSE